MTTPVPAPKGETTREQYVWQPSADYLDSSNVARLMHTLGADSASELRATSVADIGQFWDHVVRDLGIQFRTPYSRVLDAGAGIAHTEWFPGAGLNIVDTCLARWARDTPDAVAVTHESEGGAVRRLTYAELDDQVARLRAGLRARGIAKGDAVAIYLPMLLEAVVATYAIASIGAITVPLFSGFAPSAIASRLQDASAKAVITAEGTVRRGRNIPLRPLVSEAVAACPSVEFVAVVHHHGTDLDPELDAGEVPWSELLASDPDPVVEPTAASDVFLLAYTSGTTGKPKGAVHTHAGFLTKVASEVAYGFDIGPGRTFCWITDMGWIMGPLSIVGTHACGGTLLLYEGSPDQPDTHRLWELVDTHRVSMLGVSPTLIRTLRAASSEPPSADLSTVRTIGSTGEPWDPDSYDWLARDVFGARVPVINFSGGTEVGGSFLCPYPVEPIASCSLGGPALGMDVDVLDDRGNSVTGTIGELVCRQAWPSMTRGVWNDEERYLDAYWSAYPGIWRHGDHALVDEAGNWFILGRSDDVLNVAGKRVAPAEIEAVVAHDPAVTETAVVGMPDATTGEGVWVFWVARTGLPHTDDDEVATRLRQHVADQLGKPFRPSQVIRVDELPKTRSAKVMRRAIRAAAQGADPGDLSGAENPDAVEQIRRHVHGLKIRV
ncbi:AMP-binding protein [Streptomyces bobili]|uniref:AMP-binding protein n=1 Tax=Streptomyces bobili TaxID=67280 RepID=UPI0033BC7B5E